MKNILVLALFCGAPLIASEADETFFEKTELIFLNIKEKIKDHDALCARLEKEARVREKESFFYIGDDNEQGTYGPAQYYESARPVATRTQSSPVSSLRGAIAGFSRRPSLPAEFSRDPEYDELFGFGSHDSEYDTLRPSRLMPGDIVITEDIKGIASQVEAVKKAAAQTVNEQAERQALLAEWKEGMAKKKQALATRKFPVSRRAEHEKSAIVKPEPAITAVVMKVAGQPKKTTVGFGI